MIFHEAIGMANPVISLICLMNNIEENSPVLVILINGLTFIASGGYVIKRSVIFNS